jgi:hypothetical protein
MQFSDSRQSSGLAIKTVCCFDAVCSSIASSYQSWKTRLMDENEGWRARQRGYQTGRQRSSPASLAAAPPGPP